MPHRAKAALGAACAVVLLVVLAMSGHSSRFVDLLSGTSDAELKRYSQSIDSSLDSYTKGSAAIDSEVPDPAHDPRYTWFSCTFLATRDSSSTATECGGVRFEEASVCEARAWLVPSRRLQGDLGRAGCCWGAHVRGTGGVPPHACANQGCSDHCVPQQAPQGPFAPNDGLGAQNAGP
jgi:hypothetical protein